MSISFTPTIRAGICFALLCGASPADAQEKKLEVTWLSECQTAAAYDPSIISKKSIPQGADCSASYGSNLRIVDTLIGVEWPLRQSEAKAKPIAPLPEPIDFKSHKACVVAHPGGEIIDEWIVPRSISCTGRSAQSPFFRRYTNGTVCLMPNNKCIRVEELDAKGKHAVAMVIVGTLATRK